MSNYPSRSDQPDPESPASDSPDATDAEHKFLEPEILEPEIIAPQPPRTGLPPSSSGPPRLSPPPGKSFPWGYVLGGCLTVLVVMLGGLVAIGFGSFWLYKQQIAQYTSEQARPLPVVEVTADELQQLESRMEVFQEKVQQGPPPEPLILNSNDINALISNEEKLRGKVFVTIADGLVQADVSLPTDGIPGGEGRYFNGSVSVEASLENGVLIVRLQQAEVNGQPVPEAFMRAIRNENLAKDVYKNPEFAEKLRRFESLVVEGDSLILTPRQHAGEAVPQGTQAGKEPTPTESDAAQLKLPSDPLGM